MRLVGETCSGPQRGNWCLKCEAERAEGTLSRGDEFVAICVPPTGVVRSHRPEAILLELECLGMTITLHAIFVIDTSSLMRDAQFRYQGSE